MFSVSVVAYTLQDATSSDLVSRSTAWAVLGIFLVIFIAVGLGVYTLAVIWKIQSRSSRFAQLLASLWKRGESKELA
jgi:hypothetical protein